MKNIYVEGIQGMGKSTLVNRISREVPEFCVCREGDYSPVDLAWCTWMSKEEYETVLENYVEIKDEIVKYTVEEDGHFVVAYTKILTDILGFHKDLEQYEIYNGRKEFAEWKEIVFTRFKNFRGTGYLFECAFFQNIMEDLILFHGLNDEEIVDFYRELFDLVDKENFRLFYLYSENIEEILRVVKKERSDNEGNEMVTVQPSTNHLLIGAKRTRNAGQSDTHLAKGDSNMGVACNSQLQAELLHEMWYPLMMNYLKDSPYGKMHGYEGFEDMAAHFRHRQMLEMRVIKEVLGACAVVLPAKEWELDEVLWNIRR